MGARRFANLALRSDIWLTVLVITLIGMEGLLTLMDRALAVVPLPGSFLRRLRGSEGMSSNSAGHPDQNAAAREDADGVPS